MIMLMMIPWNRYVTSMGNEKHNNIKAVTKEIEKFKIQELQNYRKSRCLDHLAP